MEDMSKYFLERGIVFSPEEYICKKCDISKNYLLTESLSVKLMVGFVMPEAICQVAAVMSSAWFLVKTLKINIYMESAVDFKARFRIHKSDIKTRKDRCGTASHFHC